MRNHSTIKILGIDFIDGTVNKVVNLLKQGGLMVVPAAPALINTHRAANYDILAV